MRLPIRFDGVQMGEMEVIGRDVEKLMATWALIPEIQKDTGEVVALRAVRAELLTFAALIGEGE